MVLKEFLVDDKRFSFSASSFVCQFKKKKEVYFFFINEV